MDQQAATEMLTRILARLESRQSDPKFGGSDPSYALAMRHAAAIVRLEADEAMGL